MNAMNSSTMNIKKSEEIENIDIDYLISDVLIIKAEPVIARCVVDFKGDIE